ncbi:MAG: hypothetical protein JRF33_26715, partial [Deltaproteobacteria bacterium]|nr:hypothetical protein [Deltaproteobacteria bacterium]
DGLVLDLCTEQDGVCLGSRQRRFQCQNGAWDPCEAADFGADYLAGSERCDNLDNDCDNVVDEAAGMIVTACQEQDGVCAGSVHAAAQCNSGIWSACTSVEFLANDPLLFGNEVCDGVDNDCNGLADASDAALDLPLCDLTVGVCTDAIHSPDQCFNDGGGVSWHDCDADDYGQWYGPEDCDGLDNDCNGTTDIGIAARACSETNIYGSCDGTQSCNVGVGWNDCTANTPGPEVCDGADNDRSHRSGRCGHGTPSMRF